MAGNRNAFKNWQTKIIIGSIVGLIVGYYLFAEVSSWEKVKLGQVFYIVVGGIMIAISGIALFFSVKSKYFPKKKRKGSRPIFLEDIDRKKSQKHNGRTTSN